MITANKSNGDKNVDINIEHTTQKLAINFINTVPIVNLVTDSNITEYIANSSKQYESLQRFGLIKNARLLKDVNITAKKPALRHTDNLNGPGSYDYLIKSDKLLHYSSIEGSLYGGIPGLQITADHRAYYRHSSRPMLIIIDGTQMIDTKQSPFTLDDIDVNIVASVEILTNPSYTTVYGPNGSNGILLITTKQTPQDYDDAWGGVDKSSPGITTVKLQGYYKSREFYSPAYDNPKTNQNIADLRTTIYWKPDVTFDKNGKTTIQFFNADTPGTYKAVIEGIDSEGNVARQVYRYKVQ